MMAIGPDDGPVADEVRRVCRGASTSVAQGVVNVPFITGCMQGALRKANMQRMAMA